MDILQAECDAELAQSAAMHAMQQPPVRRGLQLFD